MYNVSMVTCIYHELLYMLCTHVYELTIRSNKSILVYMYIVRHCLVGFYEI